MYCWLGKNMLSFIRYHHTVLHGGLAILHFGQWTKLPATPHPHQHSVFSVLWILTSPIYICNGVSLLYLHLITYDIEQIFIFLFAIFISSWVVFGKSFDPFFFKQVTYFSIVALWVLYVFSIISFFSHFWKKFSSSIRFCFFSWHCFLQSHVLNFDTI